MDHKDGLVRILPNQNRDYQNHTGQQNPQNQTDHLHPNRNPKTQLVAVGQTDHCG